MGCLIIDWATALEGFDGDADGTWNSPPGTAGASDVDEGGVEAQERFGALSFASSLNGRAVSATRRSVPAMIGIFMLYALGLGRKTRASLFER